MKEHQAKKHIYIGNLSPDATEEELTANMQLIYKEEMEKGIIQTIETHLNIDGIEMAKELNQQDPTHPVTSSACVVLTSYPGKALTEVGLKLHHYERNVRVRRWNGPIPRPKKTPPLKLKW